MPRRFGVTVLLPGLVPLPGLRALEQDRLVNAADWAACTIDHRPSNWQQFRSEGIMLAGDPIKLQPAERSAYEFAEDAVPEELVPALAEAEQQEFRGARKLAACDRLDANRKPKRVFRP